jgi:Tol biopolymer transport system component
MCINKKTKLFLSILVANIILVSLNCIEWPFTRNPNLKLIKSESGAYTLFFPVFTPDGTQIYYLRREGVESAWFGGTLWKMSDSGTYATEVLCDTFCALAISSDGLKLALSTRGEETGGKLVIFNLAGLTIDTIPTSDTDIFDVEFGQREPQKIYFCSKSHGIYRINCDGSSEEFITSVVSYFDLTTSDSIVIGGNLKVHPSRPYIASVNPQAVAGAYSTTDNIILINIQTMDTTYLNANPYKFSWIEFPYWSPEGNRIVFTAHERIGDPLRAQEGEIWILENVLHSNEKKE